MVCPSIWTSYVVAFAVCHACSWFMVHAITELTVDATQSKLPNT